MHASQTQHTSKMMKTHSISILSCFLLLLLLLLIFSCSSAALVDGSHRFLQCLSQKFNNSSSISDDIYTPAKSSYTSVLRFSVRNLRFASESIPKPQVIITPEHESQIPPIIYCARENDMEIRTRSGGHDYEGLSYISRVPFVIVDLISLSEITVDAEEKTAWVGAGATIGSLYYRVAEKSSVLGFPAGLCHTVGVGGHFSGGGYGTMLRKHGLAADNVIDARIVDIKGRILDRESMGEDLFWAIRGGGGASFGVIVSWKVQLVDVPETVTVFTIGRTLEQNWTQLVHRWQYVAPKLDPDLFIGVMLHRMNSTEDGKSFTIGASFYSLFLGGVERLLGLLQESFPELDVVREDCFEMSWIQSVLYFSELAELSSVQFETIKSLLNRMPPFIPNLKIKSDYVQKPIPESGIRGLVELLYEDEGDNATVFMVPYGGRMADISESAIPFPHRAANLYMLSSVVYWVDEGDRDSERYLSWSRRYYSYVSPYVSRNPRGAYLNYRDLDIGVNNVEGETSYEEASIWGKKYFRDNFDRLVRVKTVVDPHNFFKNEQSIPPFSNKGIKMHSLDTVHGSDCQYGVIVLE